MTGMLQEAVARSTGDAAGTIPGSLAVHSETRGINGRR
jgi:hypothetical protein